MAEQGTTRDTIPIINCQWSSHHVDIPVCWCLGKAMRKQIKFSNCDIPLGNLIFFPQKKVVLILVCVFTPGLHWAEQTVGWLGMATALFSFAGLQQRAGAGWYLWRFSFSPVLPLLSFLHSWPRVSPLTVLLSLWTLPDRVWNSLFVEAQFG